MRHKQFNFNPFSTLKRRKQRDLYVSLRWRIQRQASVFGGLFSSDWMLEEPGRPAWFNQDYRCHSLGSDGHTIWTFVIRTASKALWLDVDDLANQQAQSLMSEAEWIAEFDLSWKLTTQGGKTSYVFPDRTTCYPQFGGRTYRAYRDDVASQIIAASPPDVFESFTIDRGFQYGIGVYVIVDEPHLDRAAVERTIRRFMEMGERNWQATVPVLRAHLPTVTFEHRLANMTEAEAAYGRFGHVD